MNRSTPGLPVHHQLLEFTQTRIHRVSDAIQPSHPLSSPSPLAPNPSIRVFSNESTLHVRWPKYWSFSFTIPLRIKGYQRNGRTETKQGPVGLLSTNTPLRPLGSCLLKKAVVSQALPVFQRAEKVVTD